MPRSKRNSKPKPAQHKNTTQNTSSSTKSTSSKKSKKKDLRGPHWTKNLDYIPSSKTDIKKKKFPVIKGEAVFDLQREYQNNPEKFVLNDLAKVLKNIDTSESLSSSKLATVKLLFTKNPVFYSKLGFSYIHFACELENKDNPEVLEYLLENYDEFDSFLADKVKTDGDGTVDLKGKILDAEFSNCQNRFLETPLHLATKFSLPEHVKILLDFNADPRCVTSDGFNCIDIAKERVQGLEITDLEGEPPNEVKILHDLEQAVHEFEEEKRKLEEENAKIKKYDDNIQKYLLVNGNNMQIDVNEIKMFNRHLGGDMSKLQESEDKRIIVKVQRPQIGEGMCLVNSRDKSFYSFLLQDHVVFKTINDMIVELSQNKNCAYFYATPFDEYHLVIHDIFAPYQNW